MDRPIEKRLTYTLLIGLAAGLLTLPVPLLRDLHWESASLVSLIAAIVAGWISSGTESKWNSKIRFRSSILTALLLITGWAIPLFVYAIITHCFSFTGLGYWIVGPLPSALLGATLGRFIVSVGIRRSRGVTLTILFFIATVPVIAQLLTHPQLYFFNQIWSYWPGPIYDEIVQFDSSLLPFRLITLLWSALLWSLPSIRDIRFLAVTLVAISALIFCYMNSADWGFTASEQHIQSELGQSVETRHFRIFYSSDIDNEEIIQTYTELHEQYLQEITDTLNVSLEAFQNRKIHSYIYASTEEKKWLTGAGQTSYVPVWLRQDQLHIALVSVESVLKHELVHVVAKQFGNWFGASSSIGMVEGLAVALSPERNGSTADSLVAGLDEFPGQEEISRIMGPIGFYSSAGPVSYVISGSFVAYLIREYPIDLVKQAYKTADFESVFAPLTAQMLVNGWQNHLNSIEIDEANRRQSQILFSTPSLFDKPCPRVERQRELQALVFNPSQTGPALPTDCSPG